MTQKAPDDVDAVCDLATKVAEFIRTANADVDVAARSLLFVLADFIKDELDPEFALDRTHSLLEKYALLATDGRARPRQIQ